MKPPKKKTRTVDTTIDESVKPIYEDVMVDLETVGNKPGCGILSIGAVAFDSTSDQLGNEFYLVVNGQSCLDAGLHVDPDTLAWWNKQSPEARVVLTQSNDEAQSTDLRQALIEFGIFVQQFGGKKNVKVWGNGSDFDNAILAVAYNAVELDLPWMFWNNRCYRTLKGIVPGPKLQRQGTYHNALDDAKTQAEHAIPLLHNLTNITMREKDRESGN